MKRTAHNPVLRILMLLLAVFLACPCAGGCADGQLTVIGMASSCSASAAEGIAAPDECDHDCGCPCLSDSVKVLAERPLYMPLLPPAMPFAALEPAQARVIVLPHQNDALPPSLRPVASLFALRAPPLV